MCVSSQTYNGKGDRRDGVVMKLLGSLILLFSCGGMGFLIARNYRARPRELRALKSAFQILETEIAYSLTSLPQALEKVARSGDLKIYSIFENTRELLISGEGYTPAEAWEEGLRKYFSYLALTDTDREILSFFGKCLGASDRNDQIKHIRLVVEELSRQGINAEQEEQKNSKLWTYMGVLTGLVLILLMY